MKLLTAVHYTLTALNLAARLAHAVALITLLAFFLLKLAALKGVELWKTHHGYEFLLTAAEVVSLVAAEVRVNYREASGTVAEEVHGNHCEASTALRAVAVVADRVLSFAFCTGAA